MKKIFILTLLFCCFMMETLALADVTLAVIAPRSGDFSKTGNELFKGAQLAIQEINDDGGIIGHKIELLVVDDQCDERLAISTAEMLSLSKDKKVNLVVGPYCLNKIDKVANIYSDYKIFQIIPTLEGYVSSDIDKKNQILLFGSKKQLSSDFFNFYNTNFAGLKVGFAYNDGDNAFSDVAKTLHDKFKNSGKIDLLKFYPLSEGIDFSDLHDKIIADKINIIFCLGKKIEISDFVRHVKRAKDNIIFFTNKKMLDDGILENNNDYLEGMYVFDLPGLKDSLIFTESLVNLRLLGIEPEGLETYSYVSVKLWGDLVKEVNSFDYDKLIKAANSGAMKEKWGDFLMHSGSLGSAKYIIEMYKNGEFKQVY